MDNKFFTADEISLVLSYYFELELESFLGSRQALERKVRELKEVKKISSWLLQNRYWERLCRLEKLSSRVPLQANVNLSQLLTNRTYLSRIVEIVSERLLGGSEAPSLRIAPFPLTPIQSKKLLGDGINFVLIFGAESIYFQDTVEAFTLDSQRFFNGGQRVNILGVHFTWRAQDKKKIKKALIVDQTSVVKEVEFSTPPAIDIVHILHLPRRGERELHRKISFECQKLGISQINPYQKASERADDKMTSYRFWCEFTKISLPASCLIPKRSSSPAVARQLKIFLKHFKKRKISLVVQPNKGTEGDKVKKFELTRVDEINPEHPIVKYIVDYLLLEDDALVREERGNVRYRNKDKFVRLTLRVNVGWNGEEFIADSGYAQIAKDASTFVTSQAQGGEIIDINTALANLYYLKDEKWCHFIPTDEDIATLKKTAASAAEGLNVGLKEKNYLKYVGIDIVLELCEENQTLRFTPVVLEANPRPSGLSRAKEILGISQREAKLKTTQELFKFIKTHFTHPK